MKLKYYSQSGFAKLCGVSRQAVSEAVKDGSIYKDDDGINPKHRKNKKYISNGKLKTGNALRSIAAKKVKKKDAGSRSTPEVSKTVPVKIGKVTVDIPKGEFEENSGGDEEAIAIRYMAAKTSKIEQEDVKLKLQNARLRGELLDRDSVYNGIFLYLDKLNSNLERMAGTFLQDVGYKIINAEEVTSNVRQEWIDGALKQIDAAKRVIVSRLKKIAENQK